MELSIRLSTIASMIDKCDAMADIGTDHGYIPIYLIEKEICEKAIASDINAGPVQKAKQNISEADLTHKIDCRLGGGLSTIKPYEVQCAVIAGMGGNLIRDIIEERLQVFKSLDYMILQPVQNPEILREYIYSKGHEIIEEELCFDEGKYYEILKIKYGEEPKTLDPIYYEIGERLLQKKHPLILEYIQYKLNKYCKIVNSITETTDTALNRKAELTDRIVKLRELEKVCL